MTASSPWPANSATGVHACFGSTANSPAARVALDNPLVGRLRAAGDLPVEPKQAWTPVAQFAQHGLDAVNLGPGATRYAHRADELVEIDALARTYEALRRFAGG